MKFSVAFSSLEIIYMKINFMFCIDECDGIYNCGCYWSDSVVALWTSWSAILFPGIIWICPEINTNWTYFPFFPVWNVSFWMSFVISRGLRVFVIAIKLINKLLSIINCKCINCMDTLTICLGYVFICGRYCVFFFKIN